MISKTKTRKVFISQEKVEDRGDQRLDKKQKAGTDD